MKNHLAQILIVSLIFITACKKEEQPACVSETIQINYGEIDPHPYLSYWPGSWWEFDNGKIDSCFAWEPYQAETITNEGECGTIYDNNWILPKARINITGNSWSNHSFIRGMELISNGVGQPSRLYQYWNESDQSWLVSNHKSYQGTSNEGTTNITRTRLEHLDSLDVNGTMFYNIEKIETHQTFQSMTDFNEGYIRCYYAYDIGLIRYEYGDPLFSDTAQLVNYYIAPH